MKYTHISVVAGLALTATTTNAALLLVDFGSGSSPVATSFQQATRDGATLGDFTIGVTGEQSDFDRANPNGANQVDDLYRDFVFDNNSDGFTIEISGTGIAASTEYVLTFYGYDSGEVRPTAVTAASGTVGSKLTGFASTTTAPSSLSDYSVTGNFTSDITGTLTFLVDGSGSGGSGRSAINGFEISAVPEPSTTALLGLGGLALILRRRK